MHSTPSVKTSQLISTMLKLQEGAYRVGHRSIISSCFTKFELFLLIFVFEQQLFCVRLRLVCGV